MAGQNFYASHRLWRGVPTAAFAKHGYRKRYRLWRKELRAKGEEVRMHTDNFIRLNPLRWVKYRCKICVIFLKSV